MITKWREALSLAEVNAATIGHATLMIGSHIGRAPSQLHSDQGATLKSKVINYLCNLLSFRKTRTTTYNPEGNVQVKRTNITLLSLLKSFVDSQVMRCWDKALPHCVMAYEGNVHTSIAQSPFFLNYGYKLRLSIGPWVTL